MRITKQTTCEKCANIIGQLAVIYGHEANVRCSKCGHRQNVGLVPEYEWLDSNENTKHLIAKANKGPVLASVVHIIEFGYWLWLTPDGVHGKAETLRAARRAADDYINTDHKPLTTRN